MLAALATCILLLITNIQAQDTTFKHFGITGEVASRFVWRGQQPAGSGPVIHPNLYWANDHLEFGALGIVMLANQYQEIDLYAKASAGAYSITVTDYHIPYLADGTALSYNPGFFNYQNQTTSHIVEVAGAISSIAKTGFNVMAAVHIYGNDKCYGHDAGLDTTGTNYYSTYLKAGYTIKRKMGTMEFFAAGTPKASFYGDRASFVNVGAEMICQYQYGFLKGERVSVIANPNANRAYIVFSFIF